MRVPFNYSAHTENSENFGQKGQLKELRGPGRDKESNIERSVIISRHYLRPEFRPGSLRHAEQRLDFHIEIPGDYA
jgi:hypothetical protein